MTRLSYGPLVVLALVFAPGCSSSEASIPAAGVEAEMAVNADLGADALVEEHDEGTVAWRIDTDGQVKAAVSATATGRVKQDVAGSLVYKIEGGEPKTVPLVLDAKTGLLVAAGPKLEADLTEVNYTLTVSGKPWTGVMHVPVGGTAALVAGAKVSVEAKLPEATVGPHGGTIQVVGDDRLEMVGDEGGEVRVFVLDADLKPRVSLESRTLRMGFIAERPEFVVFTQASSGGYFVGRLGTRAVVDPLRVTVSLGFGGVTRAAIWGYRPGIRIVAPSATVRIASAPRIRVSIKGGFDGDFDVYGRAHTNVRVEVRDDDRHKGNNGRHVGQDGTWERDSGGFKSDHDDRDDHHSSAKGKRVDSGDHDTGIHGTKKGAYDDNHGGSSKSSGGSSKGGGGSSKGGSSPAKGGGKGGKR